MAEGVAVAWALVGVATLALVYGFVNGYQNAATLVAPIVSTGVLRPASAVAWTSLLTAVGGVTYGLQVAWMLAFGLVQPGVSVFLLLIAALVGALIWLTFARVAHLPSSASHALMGGMIGATLAQGGTVEFWGALKVLAWVIVGPLLAFTLSVGLTIALAWSLRTVRPSRVDRWMRPGQLASCALTALGHGGNDAQKVVAVIWLAMTSAGAAGVTGSQLPTWVPYAAAASLAVGCALGGIRLISRKGEKIARLRPADGWSAESAAGLTLAVACAAGAPVSSTHVIMAGVLGADAMRADRSLRRNIRGVILWAWAVTAPASGMLAALASVFWAGAR